MTRLEFREIEQKPGIFSCKTSGSTGVAVKVQKYEQQIANNKRHKRLFEIWHNWDSSLPTLRICPIFDKPFQAKGSNVVNYYKYLHGPFKNLISFPSLMPSKIQLARFDKVMSYGERWTNIGIDQYSSEEFGCIAIQCPNNPLAMHIMPNLEIVFTPDGMRITDHDHPYLKDYEIGDYAEPVVCNCGIGLPAMTHVHGRIRNHILMPDGTKKWPVTGLYESPEIERFQVFQESLTKLRLHVTGTVTEQTLKNMRERLGYDFEIEVVEGNFKPGKHEEFICEITR
jgi:hypothetical protein